MTPLVQRSPEEADAHSAASSHGHAGGAAWDSGTQPAAFAEAGTHAAPPLPPTTFAEAQFGEAPSAAAVFASTADTSTAAFASFKQPAAGPDRVVEPARVAEPPASSAFTGSGASSTASSTPAAEATPAAVAPVAEPTPFHEPVSGWGDAPVPAPPGWASAAPAAPSFPTEPGAGAPAPITAFGTPTDRAPASDAHAPATEPSQATQPTHIAYPTPPASYEMPPELAAERRPLPVETPVAAPASETAEAAPAGRRSLPRWGIPAAVAAVVVIGGGFYLSTSGGGSTSTPVAPAVRHSLTPSTGTKTTTGTTGTAPAAVVAPATRLATAAPAGFTATGPGTPVTGAALSAADSIHRPAELTAAGVTSATVTTFSGPGGLSFTTLTETASSPAAAAALAQHARHLGYTMQAANGATVFSLHSLAKTDAIVADLTAWSGKLKG